MRTLLVGTAGHVDHGKTSLLRALTGIDCDRLPEEKRRGITLDLGFAHLERGDATIGFVDVPGHEHFLHNALAGLGGVRLLMLVVAADAGVRAQTREHLEAARRLGVPDLIVALTRIDLVDADTAGLAELEVSELLAGTPWAGAPVWRVSSLTGEGIEPLADELARRAAPADADRAADPVRLPIDRVFVARGQGVVATGTLVAGTLRPGNTLRVEPDETPVRVRSLEVHGRSREAAGPATRVAVLLAGVEAGALSRGRQLVGAGGARPARRLLARWQPMSDGPAGFPASTEVRCHLLAGEVAARVRSLSAEEPGLVELRLAAPLAMARGDRFVLRRPSPPATLGGGEILDPRWRRRRGADARQRATALAGSTADALAVWLEDARDAGATADELATLLAVAPASVAAALADLAAAGRALAGAGRWFAPGPLAALEPRARALLTAHHERERLAEGMPRAELVRRLLSRRGAALAAFHLGWLAARGVLEVRGDVVALPGRRPELSARETGLAGEIVAAYEAAGLAPPSPAEVARRLGAATPVVEGLVVHLTRRGRLLRLSGGLVIAAAAFERLREELLATGWQSFDVGRFKERFGLSRKFAIPLLERLDGAGVTRRHGDERRIVRPSAAPPPAG